MTRRSVDRGLRIAGLQFSRTELRDLLVAWVALGVAFAVFFEGGAGAIGALVSPAGIVLVGISLATAGVAFLLHEVAHKVVAVHYDQIAEFRADHGMLFLAVMSAFLGFIFAAPGAVHHRGRLTPREHGHIALAGPAVNLALGVLFAPILGIGLATQSTIVSVLGARGVAINLFLAAFNLIPYGPLDGKTVIGWNKPVWAVCFVVSALATVGFLLGGAGAYAF
ncbi:Zn-dependent protease (includes SpoIVFB) [Halopenitus malekzadehii]|uniref:Zn-dependent protease (Includes SpoIVFB) n=1 Tax=Halopenitus malekzadehii TaxID=1267564 RepID=A0A1H6HXX7_9EURY|nr:metalloprotease [Halopenitus malekzadehii]SEH41133.1 Zn-dependent protease (includes SpoIVFB) [Halopenitus malekzadehii]